MMLGDGQTVPRLFLNQMDGRLPASCRGVQ